MSKFTKGPWKVGNEAQELLSNGKLTRRYIPIYESSVSHPSWAINEPTDHPHPIIAGVHIGDDEETVASAHLISAAPELYEAAKLVLDRFNDFSPAGAMIDIPPLRKALTDALKKARGGE